METQMPIATELSPSRCDHAELLPDRHDDGWPPMRLRPQRSPLHTALLLIVLAAAARPGAAQTTPLFPAPFLVEHHVVQTEPGGDVSATEPVTDYYGGSWLVSVRPDESRLLVDFSSRELTEIRPALSTYATLSFDRLAELRGRLRAAHAVPAGEGEAPRAKAQGADATSTGHAPRITVEELAPPQRLGVSATSAAAAPGLMRLRVSAADDTPAIEVWCDRRIRLTELARAALAELEEVLGGGARKEATAPAMLAAARDHAGGAFPVHTTRRTAAGGQGTTIEDVITRLEPLASFPEELLRVPDGYRRVAHPLEAMVAFEEQEAALARGERPGR